jgi:hypothetical protein
VVTLTGNHFWRCIAWGSAGRLQRLAITIHVGKPKVDNLYIVLVVEQ